MTPDGRAIAFAGLVLFLALPKGAAGADSLRPHSSISGSFGLEFDGTEERFGSGSLFDSSLDPAGSDGDPTTPDEAILSTRFRDSAARTSVCGELTIDRTGNSWWHARAQARCSRTLTRGDLSLRMGSGTPVGDAIVENRLLFQGGPDGSGAGVSDLTRVALEPELPYRLDLRVSATAERSWAGGDSLQSLFDYRTVRPEVELSRTVGSAGAFALRGGNGRKWTDPGVSGSWRERWGEAEWSTRRVRGAEWTLRARTESRQYAARDSLLPSSDEFSASAEGRMPAGGRRQLRLIPTLRHVSYARDDSLVFQDHWSLGTEFRLEIPFGGTPPERSDLGADAEPDDEPADVSWSVDPLWSASFGLKADWLRNRSWHDADYRSIGIAAGVTRLPGSGAWGDLVMEVGRRDYHGGVSGSVAFEGFNLSLRSTDYTFLSSSVLAEAALGRGLSLSLFVLCDLELHSRHDDNFLLATGTVSVTRRFP